MQFGALRHAPSLGHYLHFLLVQQPQSMRKVSSPHFAFCIFHFAFLQLCGRVAGRPRNMHPKWLFNLRFELGENKNAKIHKSCSGFHATN